MSNPDPAAQNIQTMQAANLAEEVVQGTGGGKAYYSVAQSMAIAVQDATDNLRSITTVTSTALGVALSQFLATGDETYAANLGRIQGLVSRAATDLADIGQNAASIMHRFEQIPGMGSGAKPSEGEGA